MEYYELTHPQKRIWFTEEKYEGTAFANIAFTVKYREKIDFSLLGKAINTVIKKNEGMRIRIKKTETGFLQYVSPFREYSPEFLDFSHKDEKTCEAWLRNKTDEPFILIDNDLFSFFLMKFSDKEEGYYIKIHHVISDGGTVDLLFREIEEYYELLKNGKKPDETEYPSYIQFVSHEKAYLESPDAERDREFWLNYLSPLPEEVNLSEKKAKSDSICAKSICIKIPRELNEKVYDYCKEYKTSVFKLILSCLAIYISRITSSAEAVIGSGNHNRSTPEQKKMTGMFVSTIPLKITLDKDLNFNGFVQKNGQDINNIIKNHSKYPFDLLAGDLRKKYGVRPDYLLNITLVGLPLPEDGKKKIERIVPDCEISDVAIHILEKVENNKKYVELEWAYQIEKFTAENIERIHCLLCQIIRNALAEPHKKISKISMCPPEEEKIIFEKFNNTFFEIPEDCTAHELFEHQAELHSDKIAVVYEEQKLTYGELNRQANQLAARLRAEGLKPDMPAGILMENSPGMIVSILAVLKAGGCYLPIDPEYPSERISYMLSDSGASILLTKRNFYNKFTFNGKIYDLEDRKFFRGDKGNPEKVNSSRDLVYIIYTSGTTGRPKGVMIEHRSLINLSMCHINTHGIRPGDNTSKYMAPAFDASVLEIFPSLLSGGTLHIIPSSIRLSPPQLNDYYEQNHITSAILPTQFGEQFMLLTRNQSLRWIEMGGEKLRSFTPQRYTVYNGYGPTEYTVETSFFTIDKYYENIPIGKPVYNTSVYITDSFENLQPVGFPGELCISGYGLSRGYLNQKELTEEKFVANPFNPGTKMYKTGDMARWLPDGNLEFLGRIDRQVKIRGFRIELAEIEQAMKSFDFIKDALVVDHIDENNRLYLCGYYISDKEIDTDKLKRDLTKNLPDYMIPGYILKIDKVPLTPHGKVDKKALPVPDKSLPGCGYIAPSTEEERFLAKIWEDVLKCGSVGIHDNFFSLGGDSIMSIQVVARAREAVINISAGMLQSYPTISELLSLENVLSLKKKEEDKILTGEVPLIPIEEWFFDLNFERFNHFNQSFLFTLKQNGDREIIEKTLNILQHHHDGLRLRFRKEEGEQGGTEAHGKWIQWYEKPEKTSVSLQVVDLSSVTEELSVFITEKCSSLQSSLDITKGPVMRSALFKGHRDGKDRLFIVIHHLCIDMVSWRIILGDFHNIYKKLSAGETPSLPGKTSSYRDWSESLRNYVPAAEKHRDYWLGVLRDSSPLPLEYKESKYSDVKDYKVSLDSHDTSLLLNTVPSAYNTQINDILLSALLLAFHRSFHVSDLMIDLEGHGREEAIGEVDLSRTAGWFTTIFPLHLKSPSMKDCGSVIKSVKETLRAIPDKGLSYGVLRYLSESKEELKKPEGRRVAFNYLGQLDGSIMDGELLSGGKESTGPFVSPENNIINLLDINGFVSGGSLSMIFSYSSLIWEKEKLEELADNFAESLKEIICHCIEPGRKHFTPSDFPLAEVSQSFLDSISDPSSIEAIYGLSPLQEGLLFHALAAPDSDNYCTQTSWTYEGELDIKAIKEAWEGIFSSHPVFRTGFVWEETDKPFQVVYKKAFFPWYEADLSEADREKQEEEIEKIREEARCHGFNLSKPPLSYIHLFIRGSGEYRFIWTCHHIIIDGWSMPLIFQELHRRYEDIINKEPGHIRTAKPFEAYIKWISEQDREKTMDYWKKGLSDFSTPTPLRVNISRPDIHKTIENLKEHIHCLSEDFLSECQKFARTGQITLNALLQMAWSSVLSLYSGSEDILYGTTVSGRPPELSGVENMTGLFINTIPLRVKLNPDESVICNLKNIQNTIQEGNNFSHISLNKLQSLSDIPPGESLFYSLFVFENYPFDDSARSSKGIVMRDLKAYEKSNYPLNLIIVPGKELSIKISYDGDCFTKNVIQNMIYHIEGALNWIIQHPEDLLKDIDVIPREEKNLILNTFNDTYYDFPEEATIHELIENQAELHPDNTAVVYKDERLSYRELNERASKLAHFLRQEGVRPDSRVAILLDRSCHMIVSVLAVLKAGGAYVPIDPEYPVERIKYIISDSGSLMLITEPRLAEKIKPAIKVLDITDPLLYTGPGENPEIINNSKNLAYIIYTSGSTGQPKGVMIEHHSLVNLSLWFKESHGFTERDSISKYVSFGFDASIPEIFPPLISGASIHIIPEEIRLSPAKLNEYFERNNVTMAILPTQFGEQFMLLTDNRSLRWIEVAGDKLKTFKKQNYTVANGYGPTEYTVCTSNFIIDKYYENIPIGKPVYNTHVYILNKYGKITPVGIPGELCVSGEGVARGYLNRDELTKEKFGENPFEPGKRMYRTGDLARWLPDGNLEFLGRIDQQVKIRGFRIELGEIEEALKKIETVKDAVVIDRTDKQGNKYLCGYYISDIKLKSSELQKELSEFLPDYMIPSCFLKIEQIPLTSHGKIDRKALPVPSQSDMASHETYVAPRNEREEILASIWKEVLKCDRVGIYDNFFSLGGDSIMSIQVVARSHNEGIHITASHLLRHPTIAAMCREAEEKGDREKEAEEIPEREEGWEEPEEIDHFAGIPQSLLDSISDLSSVEAIYDLSPLQEGFLFHALSAPDSDNYCTQVSWSYKEETDIDALRMAWEDIFSLHAVFRTGFVWEEGHKPCQVVYKKVSLPWYMVDLRGRDSSEEEKIIEEIREKERRSVCNLRIPPAGSLYLFLLDNYNYKFLWTYHHIILDGWSMPLILRELQERYDSIVTKKPFAFKSPKPFESYIRWLSSQNEEEAVNYWNNCLSDFSVPTPLTVNLSRLDIHKSIENLAEYTRNIEGTFLCECQQFARSAEITLNALLQFAWSSVLSCYSGSDDILYGTTVSGRPPELAGVEHMIGLFINTIPLRVKLNYEESVLNNLKNIQHLIQEGSGLSHISLSKLQSLSGITPGEALFYSLFVFENFPFSHEMTAMKDMKTYGKSNYPLTVGIIPGKDLSLVVSYDGDCFTEDIIENLTCHIESALKWIVRNPQGLLKDMDILSEKEKNLILKTFNDTYYDFPEEITIHELIEKETEARPDKTAVVYKDDRLSYRELNEKANKLAHVLREEGVKPDRRVGIFLDRSCYMIVSILAVLKAGGAFVPIDPHYPAERINYIISDSGSLILLTEPHLAEKIKTSVKIMDATDPAIYTGSSENPEIINTSKDLVYVIYTSGSTGQPKGVMIEHHSLVNLSLWFKESHGFTEKDSISKYVSFGFDASIPEIFPPLISGASIHIIPEEIRLSPAKLNEYFERNNVTLAILPTQFGEQFMLLTDNRSLRWIEVAGDKLKTFKKQNYTVANGYGPTEYTVCTSNFIIDKYYENIPIGKPVYNTHVYILDKYGKITPVGIPGDLCVSGEGVARGYLNRDELTKEKFGENPFEPGKRMYRTGDLARWLPDGNLEFLGRIDQQVKIRGFRIELGEIEEALKKIEPVKDAVVIDRTDKQGNKYLCAYYISDIKLKSSELQKELSEFLPDYMIPSCFLKIDKIPLTTHGKLDRKALPEPEEDDLASHETYVAPRNETEEILASIWKEVLKCDRVGIYDNFFSLGGDSIMSIQVVARAHNEGIHITASHLLHHPTIASISREAQQKSDKEMPYVEGRRGEEDIDHFAGVPRSFLDGISDLSSIEAIYELSPLQEGLLFHALSAPDSDNYSTQFLWSYEGEILINELKEAWEAIFSTHAVFRTAFVWGEESDKPYQMVYKNVPLPWHTVDLSEKDALEQEKIIGEFIEKSKGSVCNLKTPPACSLYLFILGSSDYKFLWNYHHIILDGWSMSLLLRELHGRYKSILNKEALTFKSPPPFETYIRWLSGQDQEELLNYWKNSLSDFSSPTPLMINTSRLDIHKSIDNLAEYTRNIAGTFLSDCRQFARSAEVTLNALIQFAWSSLLSCYSGSDDILYGNTVSGRPPGLPGVEDMTGLFINTIPLRIKLNYEESVLSNLKNIQTAIQEGSSLSHISLSKLQPLSGIPAGESLFYSLFVFENFPFSDEITGLKDMKSYGKTNYPLNVIVALKKDLTVNISCDGDCFSEDIIERLISHMEAALKWIVKNPGRLLKDIDIVSEKEKDLLLKTFNDTYYEFPQELMIQELIEKETELHPDKTAVVYKDERLSYRELNERANKLAHFLRLKGVKPESRVGIFLMPSCHMIVSALAVIKAGGAYVPIDPFYPADRINYMMSDSSALVLITEPHLAEKIKPSIEVLDVTDPFIYSGTGENLPILNSPEDLAFIIYTSGSTGKPKGVMLEHHSLVNLCLWFNSNRNLTEKDNMAKFASFGFDASILEIFPSFVSGAALYVISDDIRLSPSELNAYFEENNITVCFFPTNFAERFIDMFDNRSLRWLVTGGDKLKIYRQRNYSIVNIYGPTECTVFTTDFIVDKYYENIPIGKPMGNMAVYILNKYNRLTPVGVPGELCIYGAGMGRGYLNRPDLTEEKFAENPFEPGKKMYRTGDLARWLPDGNIEFLGRIDHQIKIRGYRVEPGEIEEAVKKLEGIKDAVVIARTDKDGNKYLCAYYISDIKLKSSELQKELSEFLPNYMVPSYFLKIDKIPLTTHGKLDRKALPEPEESDLDSYDTCVAPRNEREEILAGIWKKVLKCKRVGIYDNFFHLGGDSIMSIQIAARAHSEGINITASQLLHHPTIASLCAEGEKKILEREKGILTGEVPLIPVEKWFFDLNFVCQAHFNQSFLFTLKEDGNREIIEKTLDILVNHHDGLRLRFRKENCEHREGGKWIQYYEKPEKSSVSVEVVDISSVPEESLSLSITEKCSSLQLSLNITEGPVIRTALFKGHKDGHDRFFIVIHHLCIDMVSWRIILEDFQSLYKKLSLGLSPSLPEKSSSYRDWSESLKRYIPKAEKHRDYWLEVLKASSPLPVEYKESAFSDLKDLKISLSLQDTDLLLNTVPSAYNTQINDILLSALLLAFHRSFGLSHLVINLEGHGREEGTGEVDLSRTVGWFTTIFPVHLTSPSMKDYGSVIKSVKETLRAIPDKGLSYGVLRYLSEKREEFKEPECKRVAFNYLGQMDGSISEGDLFRRAEEFPGPDISPGNSIINFLDVNGLVSGGSLSMVFGYSSNIWDEEKLQELTGHFIDSLKEIIRHCSKPVTKYLTPSDFPLAALSQSFLDNISEPSYIESIYGLSPLQEGLLFHALAAPDSDQYCTQFSWNYEGNLNIEALKDAWDSVFSSHPIFRTAFLWERADKPFQIVYKKASLPWHVIDLCGMDREEQEKEIEYVRKEVRSHGLNLSKLPLSYLHLFLLGGSDYRFIWTSHHILIDGWSMPLIFQELNRRYEAIINKETFNFMPPRPFEEYIKWISRQNEEEIIDYWKNCLSDFSSPTSPGVNKSPLDIHKSVENLKEYIHIIPEEFCSEYQKFARSAGVTLNALVQLAWSSVLSSSSGLDDILYGITVSGRPSDLTGVEKMIGIFINTIPLRVKLNPDEPVMENLKNIQTSIQEGSNFSYISLNKIQSLSSIPPGEALFYCLLVFENYPHEEEALENKDMVIKNLKSYEKSNYPINLIIGPGRELYIKFSYDGDCFTENVIEDMAGNIESSLKWMVQNPKSPLKDIESRKFLQISPVSSMDYYPLSSAQKRLFLINRMEGKSIAYNNPFVCSIEGHLDHKKLSHAIDKVIERHEILRTSFHIEDDTPVQKVHEKVHVKRIYREEEEGDIPGIVKDFICPFDLAKAPLIRIGLIKTGPEKYIFILDIHSIIFDDVSYDIFMKELWSFYRGVDLPPLKIHYRDFAFWYESLLKSYEIKRQKKYWHKVYEGEIPQLNLLTDFPRPSEMSFYGKERLYDIDSNITAGLKSWIEEKNTTLFITMFSSLSLLLSKYTSQEDIIIGTPVPGRTVLDVHPLIGMFVNTLPVRTFPDRDRTFEDFFKDTEEKVFSSFDNQDYQIDMLIESLGIKREASRNTLFDVMFTLVKRKGEKVIDHITVKPLPFNPDTAKLDLSLTVIEHGDNLGFSIKYRDDLFLPETIDRMAEHYINLLRNIVMKKDCKLKDMEILSEAEKNRLICEFNKTSMPYNLNRTIHELIEECCRVNPDKIAVVSRERKLTYGQLNREGNILATKLLSAGVKGNDLVAIMVSQCLEMIPGILGILKSGAAFLPVDPSYPSERIEFMLKDGGISILLTEKNLEKKLNFPGTVICLDEEGLLEGRPEEFEKRGKPSDIAYVIYTSGTTGKPKGVMIEHHSLINMSLFHKDLFSLSTGGVVTKYVSFGFDAGMSEIFPCLISGATLHIIPEEIRLSPKDMNSYFEENNVTCACLPTQFAEQFMNLVENRSLRHLYTGGDKLGFFKKQPYKVINCYGPTEYTVTTTTFNIDSMYDNIPIGKPVANTDVYILDRDRLLLPVGVPGELYISGPGLSRGYLNRQELTEEKFVNNPFRPGHNMYRTGDLARWLSDGNIEFLGRIDEQVKIRGYRIELGEIEHALKEYPDIKDVSLIAREITKGDKSLCAYIVSDIEIDIETLKEFLKKTLPEYMVPSYFIRLEKIPLTPNGKVDRRSLPSPDMERDKEEIKLPKNEAEEKICRAWEKILEVSNISMTDNFFTLGGHSLKAVALVAELQKDFEIKLNDVFKYQTIEEMAKNLTGIKDNLKKKLLDIKKDILTMKADVKLTEIEKDILKYREDYKKYSSPDLSLKRNYKNILLTGATGFLGSYLLRDLLKKGNYYLYVPVRGKSEEECRERLVKKLDYYFGPELFKIYSDRIKILKSDLSDETLSLDKELYEELSLKIDCIINSAASVKHYGLYKEFYNSNVKSVQNLLKFAFSGRTKDIHHVSTISVGEGQIKNKKTSLFTEDMVDRGQTSENYYLQTKLEGEKLLVEGRRKGVMVNIYRAGNITFDSETGIFQENIDSNAFYQRIKSFINLGIVPMNAGRVDLSCVDGVSGAILSLFDLEEIKQDIFHIENTAKADLSYLLSCPGVGLNVEPTPLPLIIDYLLEHYDHSDFREYIENLMVHMGWMDYEDIKRMTRVVTLSEKTGFILNRAGYNWPSAEVHSMKKMIYETLKDRISMLKACPVFSGLSSEELGIVAGRASLEYYEDESEILVEGKVNDSFYVIARGAVSISCTSRSGWIGTVSILGEGNILGENNIFGEKPSEITAEPALGDVLLLRFNGKDMENLISRIPPINSNLIKELNNKIAKLQKIIVTIG